ncbi:NAD(P)H-dependent oxidoreductase [Brevundimonas sp.]|uniref:NAD(P)H-dependent oxidoreductase n=1 Tax=Brevundimonas sp. TaxID=1871086 RepID=UPI0025D222D7|nr:NAD(P)H-dependent oxidoreductase [Brevundimonas sp.]
MKKILVINGHPDRAPERLAWALSEAYAAGARQAGHEVRRLDVGALQFPLLRSAAEFNEGAPPPAIADVQRDIKWADHLVIVFPLWLGGLPALTKGFFEQVFRPQFTMRWRKNQMPQGLLEGLTVRLVVTMGMPAFAFRLFFGASGVRSFEKSVLGLAGIRRTGTTMFGGVGSESDRTTAQPWLAHVTALGRAGR